MKKRLLLILLLNVGLTVTPYVNASITNEDTSESYISLQKLKYGPNIIPVGHLNVSVTETIKLKPDIAEFSITYTTEGKSPNDASNRNQNNMKNFKEYLASLNIVDKNLTTIDYQNYEQDSQTTVINENEKYQSSLKINLIINAKEQFPSIFKILDENKINNIKYDSYKNYYVFDIIETGETIEKAKQKANNKYLLILKYLKQLNMDNISILEYDSQAAPQKQVSEKKYYVRNTIKINVTNLDNIGKIIAKAQELKMIVNNDINYRVSESATQHAIEQYETTLLNKLNKKASRLLTEQYIVGVPTVLNSSGGQDIEDAMSKNYSYRAKDFNSASSKSQIYQSDSVDIQPPSEFKIILTLSGTFEILKSIIDK